MIVLSPPLAYWVVQSPPPGRGLFILCINYSQMKGEKSIVPRLRRFCVRIFAPKLKSQNTRKITKAARQMKFRRLLICCLRM